MWRKDRKSRGRRDIAMHSNDGIQQKRESFTPLHPFSVQHIALSLYS